MKNLAYMAVPEATAHLNHQSPLLVWEIPNPVDQEGVDYEADTGTLGGATQIEQLSRAPCLLTGWPALFESVFRAKIDPFENWLQLQHEAFRIFKKS